MAGDRRAPVDARAGETAVHRARTASQREGDLAVTTFAEFPACVQRGVGLDDYLVEDWDDRSSPSPGWSAPASADQERWAGELAMFIAALRGLAAKLVSPEATVELHVEVLGRGCDGAWVNLSLLPDGAIEVDLTAWPFLASNGDRYPPAGPGVEGWLRGRGWEIDDDIGAVFESLQPSHMPTWWRAWPAGAGPTVIAVELAPAFARTVSEWNPARYVLCGCVHGEPGCSPEGMSTSIASAGTPVGRTGRRCGHRPELGLTPPGPVKRRPGRCARMRGGRRAGTWPTPRGRQRGVAAARRSAVLVRGGRPGLSAGGPERWLTGCGFRAYVIGVFSTLLGPYEVHSLVSCAVPAVFKALREGIDYADDLQSGEELADRHYWAHSARYRTKRSLVTANHDAEDWDLVPGLANSAIHLLIGFHRVRLLRFESGSSPSPGSNRTRRRAWNQQLAFPIGRGDIPPLSLLIDWHLDGEGEPVVSLGLPKGCWEFKGDPLVHWRVPLHDDGLGMGDLSFDPGEDDGDVGVRLRLDDHETEDEG